MRENVRFAFVAAAVALTSTVLASGPDNQFGYKTPIVRIAVGNSFNGTGTVIHNEEVKDPNGGPSQGYFCVLTADHVIAPGQAANPYAKLGIAFGQLEGVNSGPFPGGGFILPNGVVVGRQAKDAAHPNEKVDMAILKIPYGNYNKAYDQYVMNVDPTDIDVGDPFSSAGYGNQGDRFVEAFQRPGGILQPDNQWWNGYKGSGNYQLQLAYYNSVERIEDRSDWTPPTGKKYDPYDPSNPNAPQNDRPDGYAYESMVYTNTSPTARDAITLEGVGFDGDSGAPYMSWDGAENLIVGIHTYGEYLDDPNVPGLVKPWGFEAGGVHLNDQYRDWIEATCMKPVPEPSTLAAGLASLVALAARRKRR